LAGSENSSDHPIWNQCIPEWRQHSVTQINCGKPARMGGNNTQILTWASEPMLLHRWSSRLRRASDRGKVIYIKFSTEKNAALISASHFIFEYCIHRASECLDYLAMWASGCWENAICHAKISCPSQLSGKGVGSDELSLSIYPSTNPCMERSFLGIFLAWDPWEIVSMHPVWLNKLHNEGSHFLGMVQKGWMPVFSEPRTCVLALRYSDLISASPTE
jgi:hypothetical protein